MTTDQRASTSLETAIWRSAAAGVGGWLLAVGVLVAVRNPDVRGPVLAVHVVLAIAGLLATAARRRLLRAAYLATVLAVLGLDLLVAADELSVTVVVLAFVLPATPFLVLPWPWAMAAGWGPTAVVLVAATDHGIGGRTALTIAAAAVCYSGAAVVVIAGLRGQARATDDLIRAVTEEQERTAAARASARTAAEYARTLHDTVVNTLGAIAGGGGALREPLLVRRRCEEDLAQVAALLERHPAADGSLDQLGAHPTLRVERTGPDPSQLALVARRLLPERRRALTGIVDELVRNVHKHAGTDRVRIDLLVEPQRLVVTVADDGCGFVPRPRPGRGLAESVLARAADVGCEVDLRSVPGTGTRAVVACPLDRDRLDLDDHAEVAARALRRAGAWRWAAPVTAAGLVTGIAAGASIWAFGAVAVVGTLVALAHQSSRRRDDLPAAVALACTLGVPAAFVVHLTGLVRGLDDPMAWPAIGLTPLLVLLLVVPTTRRWAVLAVAALVATAGGAALVLRADHPLLAGLALANAGIQLAQLAVWVIFVRIFDDLVDQAAADRRRLQRERADQAALDSAQAARQRWQLARLEAVVALLRSIAEGRCDPADPAVRRQAAEEEHALRQLLLLDPGLVHLGTWLAQALGEAREHEVRLRVRVGDHDLPDAASAGAVGETLLGVVRGVAPGAELTIAAFGQAGGPCLTVVGPAGVASTTTTPHPGVQVVVTRLAGQELLEIRPAGSAAAPH